MSANRKASDERATDDGQRPIQSPEENTFADPMCKTRWLMRIETSGKYADRLDLYDRAGDVLGEKTRSGAIDGACAFTCQMLPALRQAVEHPDMTPALAEILSTEVVEVEYRVETGVSVRDE